MSLNKEAALFGRYIIEEDVNETAIERYIQGVEKLGYNEDNKLIDSVLTNPFLLPYVDAGLAFTDKKHLLQKKLLLMFSILETIPEYSSKFLSQPKSVFYIFTIIWIGIKGVIKAFFGIIVIKLMSI